MGKKQEQITPGLEDQKLNELVDKPIDTVAAQVAINADREARIKEFAEIVQREGRRLSCDIVAVAELAGTQSSTFVRIVATK